MAKNIFQKKAKEAILAKLADNEPACYEELFNAVKNILYPRSSKIKIVGFSMNFLAIATHKAIYKLLTNGNIMMVEKGLDTFTGNTVYGYQMTSEQQEKK